VAIDARIGQEVALAAFSPLVAYVNSCKVGLFKNATIPEEWQDLASYSQPANAGYGLVSPLFIEPEDPPGPVYHALSTPIEWTADTGGPEEFINGWFLYDEEAGLVVLALLYGLPEPFIRIGPFWISADLSTFFSVFS